MSCQLETCEKLFVKLGLYWRSALIGFIALLSLGAGAWTWTWAEWKQGQAEQNTRIINLESAFNDITVVRSQTTVIIANQEKILKELSRRK
jgi:hypothetical protein